MISPPCRRRPLPQRGPARPPGRLPVDQLRRPQRGRGGPRQPGGGDELPAGAGGHPGGVLEGVQDRKVLVDAWEIDDEMNKIDWQGVWFLKENMKQKI